MSNVAEVLLLAIYINELERAEKTLHNAMHIVSVMGALREDESMTHDHLGGISAAITRINKLYGDVQDREAELLLDE